MLTSWLTNARGLWRDLRTPSARYERPWLVAVTACGHALIGAAAAVVLWYPAAAILAPAWIVPLLLGTVYYIRKETGDIGVGGTRSDAILDTAHIMLGACVVITPWALPLAIVGAIGDGVLRGRA